MATRIDSLQGAEAHRVAEAVRRAEGDQETYDMKATILPWFLNLRSKHNDVFVAMRDLVGVRRPVGNPQINPNDPDTQFLMKYLYFLHKRNQALPQSVFMETYLARFDASKLYSEYKDEIPTTKGLKFGGLVNDPSIKELAAANAQAVDAITEFIQDVIKVGLHYKITPPNESQGTPPVPPTPQPQTDEEKAKVEKERQLSDAMLALKNFTIQSIDPIKNKDGHSAGQIALRENVDLILTVVKERKSKSDAIAKYRSSADTPVSANEVVYACISREHAGQGLKGRALAEATVRDFSELAILESSKDFSAEGVASPGEHAPLRDKAEHHVDRTIAAAMDLTRSSVREIFKFPALTGLSLESDAHAVEHYLDKVPVEKIIALIGMLRHEVEARHNGIWQGINRADIFELNTFIHHLEAVVAKKMKTAALAASSERQEEALIGAATEVRKSIVETLAAANHDPKAVHHDWEHMAAPPHDAKDTGGHHKGAAGSMASFAGGALHLVRLFRVGKGKGKEGDKGGGGHGH